MRGGQGGRPLPPPPAPLPPPPAPRLPPPFWSGARFARAKKFLFPPSSLSSSPLPPPAPSSPSSRPSSPSSLPLFSLLPPLFSLLPPPLLTLPPPLLPPPSYPVRPSLIVIKLIIGLFLRIKIVAFN